MLEDLTIGMNARDQWVTLEESYLSNVQSKDMNLRDQLQSLKKENISVSQYEIKGKTIAGHLASVGEPVNDKDLTLYLLGGLGSHYLSFKTNINCYL